MEAPTEKWTEDERKSVVLAVTEIMLQSIREPQRSIVGASEVQEWAETIDFVLTKDAHFLQVNRGRILRTIGIR